MRALAFLIAAQVLFASGAAAQEKLLIAHRGASSHAPENTIAAIDAAIARQVDVIELDVQLSRDFVPVVVHDDTLQRTTDVEAVFPLRARVASDTGERTWFVRDFSIADLRRLDAGSWFAPEFSNARIPTLVEALRQIGGRVAVLVDLKVPAAFRAGRATTAQRIAAAIATAGSGPSAPWIGIASFDERDLYAPSFRYLPRFINRDLTLQGLPGERQLFPPGVCGLAVSRRLLAADPDIVRRAHEQGRLVLAWSFDAPPGPAPLPLVSELSRYIQTVDVDGIMTNRLDEFAWASSREARRVSWSACYEAAPEGAPEIPARTPPAGTPIDPTRRAQPRD